jgi:hypothetical protein
VTRLRQMMLAELQRRNYSNRTTRYYLQAVCATPAATQTAETIIVTHRKRNIDVQFMLWLCITTP